VIPRINPAKQGYSEDFTMFRYASVLAAVVALCLTGTSEAKGGRAGGGRGGRGMARSSGMRPGYKTVSRKPGRGREYGRGRGYRGYGYRYGYGRYRDYRGYGYRHGYYRYGYPQYLGYAVGDGDDQGDGVAVGNDGGYRGGYRYGYRHRHHRGHRFHPYGHGSRGGKRR
jgi:hypothetical protein